MKNKVIYITMLLFIIFHFVGCNYQESNENDVKGRQTTEYGEIVKGGLTGEVIEVLDADEVIIRITEAWGKNEFIEGEKVKVQYDYYFIDYDVTNEEDIDKLPDETEEFDKKYYQLNIGDKVTVGYDYGKVKEKAEYIEINNCELTKTVYDVHLLL